MPCSSEKTDIAMSEVLSEESGIILLTVHWSWPAMSGAVHNLINLLLGHRRSGKPIGTEYP